MVKWQSSYAWKKIREQHLEQFPNCLSCGITKEQGVRMEVHHIHPVSKGGQWNNPNNLVTLCRGCHRRINHNEEPKTKEERKWDQYLKDKWGLDAV